MAERQYFAFDIETAKVLPDGVTDLLVHRPLGIACAAGFVLDTGEEITWHGTTASGAPAPRMTEPEVRSLLDDLADLVSDGYTLVTWNGASFDFNILAEESGARDRCIQLGLDHVDMMFHVVCSQGHYLSLQKAALGMSLKGKVPGVSGADAPRMWANGEYEEVLEYNLRDVRLIAELAAAGDRAKALHWLNQRGTLARMTLPNGWVSVREALQIPQPDVSWMTNPPNRAELLEWTT